MPAHSGPHTCTKHHRHTEGAQRSAVVAATAQVVAEAGVQVQVALELAIALVVEAEPGYATGVEEKQNQRYELATLHG